MRKKKFLIFTMLLALIISILPIESLTVQAEETVLKIGYDSNSKFIQEHQNEFYGYGVEYLNKVSEYTGWKYEYVNDVSWHDSLGKLRNGEIDLICTAHYTEERAQEFLYSDIPLGYEATLLYAGNDSNIFYQDYEAINGCKVGLLLESYSAKDFSNYAAEHNITCEQIYFNRENDMMAALHNGSIDMIAIGSRYGTADLNLVDRLGANAFYCITSKENQALINELEDVLQEIMFDDPDFEGGLNSKYFGHSSLSHIPPYTKEELAFIENLGTVKVKMLSNQQPSLYEKNGEVKGIWAEYIKLISQKTGISFEMETGKLDGNAESLYNELLENDYLLLRTSQAMQFNNTTGIITSLPLMDIDASYIVSQKSFVNNSYDNYTIALTQDLAYLEPLLLEEFDSFEFLYCDDSDDCLEAVLKKEASIAVQSAFRTSYLMQKPEYADKLMQISNSKHNNQILLVGSKEQEMLISIINKAIHHISDEEINTLVSKELLQNPYVVKFDDFWYQSWEWIVGIGIIIIVSLGVYITLNHRMTKLKIQKKEFEILQKKVQLDEVTGLYNRTYFYEIAKDLIENSEEEMCIITMDISNFRIVNELYGMNIGDQLLKEVADQIKKMDTSSEMLPARFMADHYYLCMPKRIFDHTSFPKRFQTFLEDMDIKVVYGVFFVKDQKSMPINIMCDRAFLAAHDKSYKYVEYIHFYNDSAHKQLMEEQEIEKQMEKALEQRQFYIVVQPKYNSITQKIVGGEALVRWQHPEKGMISPGIFIKIFEKNGFIIQLDYFVWEETCRLLSDLKHAGKPYVPISVNVSRAHFYGSELLHKLNELIQKYDLDPQDLELEITESLCGEDPDTIYAKMRELQNMGFKIAIDDFGSGYSSLNMLKEMPLDIIKMDLKFLDGEQQKGRLILKALIGMAHTLELKIVVEGVEILSQVEFLSQFNDCSIQGYYFSRPVVRETFEEMLEKN